jgi:integrase
MRNNGTARRQRIAPNLYLVPATGRFMVGFGDPLTGRWRMQTLQAATRTDAKAERDRFLTRLRAGEVATDTSVTVAELAGEWLASFESRVAAGERAPRTLERYEHNLRCHVLPLLGRKKASTVRVEHVLALEDHFRTKGLSAWTRRGILVALSRLFAFGVRRGACTRNPVRDLDVEERPRVQRTKPRILMPGEIDRLLGAATETYRPALATIAYSGLRASEALGLVWEDIDLDEGVIHVRAQLERGTKQSPAARRRLKTAAAVRDVPIPDKLENLLRSHQDRRALLGFGSPQDLVFGTATGAPIRYDNLRVRGLNRAARSGGLLTHGKKAPTLHALRHGYGSWLVRAGDDVANVARRLGHSSPSTTLGIYTHEVNEQRTLAETKQRLDTVFGRAGA